MRKYLILGSVIILTGLVINALLGGFDPVEPVLVSTNETILYGWPYEGGYDSDSLNNRVDNLREILSRSNAAGQLTIVNYIEPTLEKRGMVKEFIGIEWKDLPAQTAAQFDTLKLTAYNGFQFVVPIKPLVMPSPVRLKKLAEEAAKSMNSELLGYSIEQYKNNSLVINYPLK